MESPYFVAIPSHIFATAMSAHVNWKKKCEFSLQILKITQILREINFIDSMSAKSAIFNIFRALNCNFLQFLKAEICQSN